MKLMLPWYFHDEAAFVGSRAEGIDIASPKSCHTEMSKFDFWPDRDSRPIDL